MQTLTSSDQQTSSCQDLPCPREASPSTSKASSLEAHHAVASPVAVVALVVVLLPVVAVDSVTEVAVVVSLLVAVAVTVAEVHPEADTEQTEMHDA